jgi:ParB family chromosome partitioning protein
METPSPMALSTATFRLRYLPKSTSNPRRIFEDNALKELAESIHTHGVLSLLLGRPLNLEHF